MEIKETKVNEIESSNEVSNENNTNSILDTKKTKKKKKRVNKLRNQKIESSFQKANKKLTTRINNLKKKDKNSHDIYSALKNGSNQFLRMNRVENSNFDLTWIKKIEDCIPALDEIIRNPKITTKSVSNVVPIELARKTNSESIQHLSTHSQFVKEINDEGEVIPSKILNIEAEDNYITYENKFIATLIRRLLLFVEKRYEYIEKYSPMKDYEILYVKNRSVINGVEYIVESKVIAVKESESSNDKLIASQEFAKRIAVIRKYVKYFYSSSFMKMFKNEKNVRAPIIQTNIIRKNPRYRKCYELFKFIERYDKLGVNFVIKEDYKDFSEKDKIEMYNLSLANVLTLKSSDTNHKIKSNKKVKSPKILKSMDDDIFTFYPLGTDPEFIRIDEDYLNYKETNTKDLKKNPDDLERKFKIGNYLKKGKNDVEKKRREELLKRKKKENIQFEKEQKRLLAEQEKEMARREAEERKAIEKARQAELEKAREYVRNEAKKQNEEMGGNLDELEKARLELAKQAELDAKVDEEPIEEAPREEPTPKEEPVTEDIVVEEKPIEEPVIEEAPKPVEIKKHIVKTVVNNYYNGVKSEEKVVEEEKEGEDNNPNQVVNNFVNNYYIKPKKKDGNK